MKNTVVLLLALILNPLARCSEPAINAELSDNQIASVRLFNMPPKVIPGIQPINRHYVEVTFSSDVAANLGDLAPLNIDIRALPSNKQLTDINVDPTETQFVPGTSKIAQVVLQDVPTNEVLPGDDQVRITFHQFHFASSTVTDLSATGKIYNQSNIASFKDEMLSKLKESVASAKTQSEKDFFAGLNVTVPSGGGDAQGNGDINLNHTFYAANITQRSLFDQAVVGLEAKKASETNADPQHFQVGATVRKVFLLASRRELASVRDAILGTPTGDMSTRAINDPTQPNVNGKKPEDVIRTLQRRFFRAIYFDNGLQFEGDIKGASIGNVSNLVYTGRVQVTTINHALGGSSSFFNLRLLPIGTELGHNVNDSENPQFNNPSIIRLNNGAAFNVFYDNPTALPVRIELSVDAINRHLFHAESAFDTTTQKASSVTSGNKYWVQADAKLLFIRTQHGRAGLRVTFQRGYLAPVYNFTKAFNIGLVFETPDSDTSKDLRLQ
jgi:hypothetical protein